VNKSIIAVTLLTSAINTSHAEVFLDPIVITATRSAQVQSTTLSSVTVIDRAQIEGRSSSTVYDILRAQSGIDITRLGGVGQPVSVFLRGTESDHVLVLIDGIRASSATTGQFSWQNLPTSQIERIEIVRGPRTSLYGSDAIGGVIQIFTRKSDGPMVRAEIGAFDTNAVELGWGTHGVINTSINAEVRKTNGFSSTNSNNFFFDPDHDGSRSESLAFNIDTHIGEGSVYLQTIHSQSETDLDTGISELTNQSVAVGIDYPMTSRWNTSVKLGHYRDFSTSDYGPFGIFEFNTVRSTTSWLNTIKLHTMTNLTAGLDYRHENGEDIDVSASVINYDASINNTGVFVHLQNSTENNNFSAAIRRDSHSTFGSKTTGSIAAGYHLNKQFMLRASWGSAFKAPTINDLFHPGTPAFDPEEGLQYVGNPNLEPETSNTIEIGLDARIDGHNIVRVSLFQTQIKNLIAPDFTSPQFDIANIGSTKIEGIEIEWHKNWGSWDTSTNATLQKPINEDTGTDLLRRPRKKATVRLGHTIQSKGKINLEVLLRSDSKDFASTLSGYGIANIDGYYELSKYWRAEVRIENVLDKTYEVVSGYNPSPRSAFIAFRYTPSE
jgi:vitamin B12 transporter